jgi:uncharacterized protein
MKQQHHILAPKEQIEAFCKKHFIGRLSLFGSILRDDFKPESDVDVLVEFQHGHKIGLLKMARMEAELSEILKRKVDLRTPGDLSCYFRQEVVQNAEVQYAQGMERRGRKSQIVNRKSDNKSSSFGFTSIELIVVIMCLAILMFAIGTRFNRNEMGSAVAADQLIADIRYIQLKAISIGRPYQIVFNGNSYRLSRADDNVEIETKTLPNSEIATADVCTTLRFNTLGEPNIGSDCLISLSGDSAIKVRVYNITGKAE